MDGVILLQKAREAGLAVAAESGKLVIRGPEKDGPVARLLLDRESEVLAALEEIADWHARYQEALARRLPRHPVRAAERLAWGKMIKRWRRLHAKPVPRSQCAECGEAIGEALPLDLIDGNRAHFEGYSCIKYVQRWREAATRALVAMGLQPPASA
jgi:hypothetical protein